LQYKSAFNKEMSLLPAVTISAVTDTSRISQRYKWPFGPRIDHGNSAAK